MDREESIDLICGFLDRIGIRHSFADTGEDSFLPGLRIEGGQVIIDREKVPYPGDILHEAGHLALVLPEERANFGQEDLKDRPSGQGEEIACQLWTFLAAKDIGLPVEIVFHEAGYQGGSQWFIDNYESGNYIGLPLLTWMGITESGDGMPVVKSWVRP